MMEKSRVAIVRSKTYGEETEKAVERAVELIGGPEAVLKRGDVVLIKPNMVHKQSGESGHVTHWSLVKKAIEIADSAGASRIIVGDGSADGTTPEAFEKSGVTKVVDSFESLGAPVELIDLNYDRNPRTGDFDAVDVGIMGCNQNFVYRVAHSVLIADVIISIPKIKSHNGTGITISLKNFVGTAPGGHYGFPKKKGNVEVLPHCSKNYDYGNKNARNMKEKYDLIWRTIVDLNMIARGNYPGSPRTRKVLSVVDGIVGGSYSYRSTEIAIWDPVMVGVVVAGLDSVAVDTVCSKIMCYRPERIPLLVNASAKGLGTMDSIDVIGEKVKYMRNFVPPADEWLGIVDKRMPFLWPRLAYLNVRKMVVGVATRPNVYSLVKKIGLARERTADSCPISE